MSIETLKEQARRHEQKEEWLKALEQYKKAIQRLEADDQPDIGLYNRVGDLYVRVGRLHEAVEHYRRAVDLYLESELPNNAIAVCKKIIRNVPDRHDAYLRIGQIRAQQGFLPDARTNFLTYAERMQQAGDLDESFRALVEFCDLAPDDHEVRVAVAEQMVSQDRVEDAVAQLSVAYRTLMQKGETMAAIDIETKIRELDPNADLTAVAEPTATADDMIGGADADLLQPFGDIELSGAFTSEGHESTEDLQIERHVLDLGLASFTEESVEESGEETAAEEEPVADAAPDEVPAWGAAGGQEYVDLDEPAAVEETSETPPGEPPDEASFALWEEGGDATSEEEAGGTTSQEEAVEAISEEEHGETTSEEGHVEVISEDEHVEEVFTTEDAESFDLPLMEFDDEEIGEVVAADDADGDEEEFELPLLPFETEEGEIGIVEPGSAVDDQGEDALELPMMEFATEETKETKETEEMEETEGTEGADERAGLASTDAVEAAMEEAAADLVPDLARDEEWAEPTVEEPAPEAAAEPTLPTDAPDAEDVAEPTDAEPLPEAAAEPTVEETDAEEVTAEVEPEAPSLESLRARIEAEPDDVNLRQRLVETAYRSGDDGALAEAYLGLGETLQRAGQTARAKVAFQQCLQHDPRNEAAKAALGEAGEAGAEPVKEVASHEEYVDLGALVLDDDTQKTTRFTVAYQEPSGDEQADFAKMLSQFKEKVSENLDADDVRAHHDLGTAYKEMGLLDEAVSEFQAALRASASHLPTYELLGQTFMEMGRMDMAIRSLERALGVDFEIEDELIGIYYYLARAYEQMGRKDDAVEFYDRVFSLDINFADVTERLRTLR